MLTLASTFVVLIGLKIIVHLIGKMIHIQWVRRG
jgi:hypothetical protein